MLKQIFPSALFLVAMMAGPMRLAGQQAPVIERQPVTQGAFQGGTNSLSVLARPSPSDPAGPNAPLTYQWYFGTNPVAIVAGTFSVTNSQLAELVFTNSVVTNSGVYRVAVASGTNVTFSEPATLTVVAQAASQLRMGNVSITNLSATTGGDESKPKTAAAPDSGKQPGGTKLYSIPLVLSVAGNERRVGVTFGFDPSVIHNVTFAKNTNNFEDATVLPSSDSGRFAFVYSLPVTTNFASSQELGRLTFEGPILRDSAETLAAARLSAIATLPGTNIARPFLPLPLAADRAGGTNLADVITFPLNVVLSPQVVPTGPLTLNRQTGYFQQNADVVNIDSTAALTDTLVTVTGLANDSRGVAVALASSVGTTGNPASPFIFLGPLAPNGIRRFTLEYYVSDGRPESVGAVGYDALSVGDSRVATTEGRRSILPTFRSTPGGILLEFSTLTNFSYYVRYSDSLDDFSAQNTTNLNINTARPSLRGTGRFVQWLDNGPPRTQSVPTTNRFYRVLEFR